MLHAQEPVVIHFKLESAQGWIAQPAATGMGGWVGGGYAFLSACSRNV